MPEKITKCGLAAMPPGVGKACAERGYCGIYVIGFEGEAFPVKIGIAENVRRRFEGMQTGNWKKLALHSVVWTAGPPLARRVEAKAHDLLRRAGKHVSGEWFAVPPEWAQKTIFTAAGTLSIPIFSHDEMLRRSRAKIAKDEARLEALFGL